MLLPEFLTFDDTFDMWKISVNYITCCCWWCRRHQIWQEIVSNFAISVTSLRKFLKSMNLPNPTKQFWFGLGSLRSVRFC